MPRSRRHPIDEEATLDRYEERLRSMPEEAFRELDNAWLETFEVYSTFTGDHIDCADPLDEGRPVLGQRSRRYPLKNWRKAVVSSDTRTS